MTKEKKDTKCDELIDALLEKHGISPEAVLGENGLIAQLKKRVIERALVGQLTRRLGYAKGEAPEEVDKLSQRLQREEGGWGKRSDGDRDSPDRGGSFDPLLIAKGQKRFEGFDEQIIALYARGMTVREIAGSLLDRYKVEVRWGLHSTVTDSVLRRWRSGRIGR